MNNSQSFKFIKGEYRAGAPADICFYTDVEFWSVGDFLWEFDYLVNHVNPSKIRIHINSAGGSVVDGMSVFAKIMDCKIATECINDALAASMGSIIWAAGDDLYMKDYALLMIHNPFRDCNGSKEYDQTTDTFAQQLKTIYVKRFGLSEDEVEGIMNGKEGEDGTFLTAQQAVERGFVKADHIIETPKVVRDKIQAALKGCKDVGKMKEIYELALPTQSQATINEQKHNSNIIQMEENKVSVFAALFGMTGEKATADNVTAKINELKAQAAQAEATQKSLDETKAELTQVKAELTGAQTTVKNLSTDLDSTKEALKKFQDAEVQAQKEKINALIDKAIEDCKINKEERADYLAMAEHDYSLAERILAKIPARDNLSNVISEANKGEAQAGMKSEEQQIQEIVKRVVGADFKFRTLA